jgi:hypothetical protein
MAQTRKLARAVRLNTTAQTYPPTDLQIACITASLSFITIAPKQSRTKDILRAIFGFARAMAYGGRGFSSQITIKERL